MDDAPLEGKEMKKFEIESIGSLKNKKGEKG